MGSIFGGGSTPYVQPDTLRSTAQMVALDLLSEGPVQGLVNGLASIFFDDTPVYVPNLALYYFNGVTVSFRAGLEMQAQVTMTNHQRGISAEEFDYNQKISSVEPQFYDLDNPDLTHAAVIVNLPALSITDTKGNINSTSCVFDVSVQYPGGTWKIYPEPIFGKCSSEYQFTIDFPLPMNPLLPANEQGPWTIRVRKQTPDGQLPLWSTNIVSNDLYVQSIIGYTALPLVYPYSAVVQTTLDATFFGASIPVRSYEIYGIIVNVPSNYDAWARTYTGIWDGTFKQSWTNNPAWVIYDLIANDRYGLGMFVSPAQIDKWSLYEIAQYCDELVPDGLGGMELRFAFNGVLNSAREAFDTLAAIASVFFGMAYWSSGTVTVSQDRAKDPVLLVTPSNVVDGNFNYKSSAIKARHTAAYVKWNDPQQHYRENWEAVEDSTAIARYGYRQMTIEAVGCTSRGQARRFGLWSLLTELVNTQTLTYQAGLDHAIIMPGDIIQIQDPALGEANFGGRLRNDCTTTQLVLDRLIGVDLTQTYSIYVLNSDGSIYEGTIASFHEGLSAGSAATADSPLDVSSNTTQASPSDINLTPGANETADSTSITADSTAPINSDPEPRYSVVKLVTAMAVAPAAGAVWVIQNVSTAIDLYQVIGKKETDTNIYEITAVQHTPELFAAIDAEFFFDPLETAPTTAPGPVTNLNAQEQDYYDGNGYFAAAYLSWTAPAYEAPLAFHVTATGPDGFVDYGVTTANSITLRQLASGQYTFQVAAVGAGTYQGAFTNVALTISGWQNTQAPTPTSLTLADQAPGDVLTTTPQQFAVPSPTIQWTNSFPDGVNGYPAANIVRVYHTSTNTLLRTVNLPAGDGTQSYTYTEQLNTADGGPFRDLTFSVTALNPNGAEGTAATLEVINNPPKLATNINVAVQGTVVAVSFNADPSDAADIAGARIFVSTTNTPVADPETNTTFVYDGSTIPAQFVYANPGTFYLSIGIYDTFGVEGMQCTAPVAFSIPATTQVTQVNDADYQIKRTDRTVALVAATQSHTFGLPLAANYPTGTQLTIVDETGEANIYPINVVANANGPDTINGQGSYEITGSYGFVNLQSNGGTKWTIVGHS